MVLCDDLFDGRVQPPICSLSPHSCVSVRDKGGDRGGAEGAEGETVFLMSETHPLVWKGLKAEGTRRRLQRERIFKHHGCSAMFSLRIPKSGMGSLSGYAVTVYRKCVLNASTCETITPVQIYPSLNCFIPGSVSITNHSNCAIVHPLLCCNIITVMWFSHSEFGTFSCHHHYHHHHHQNTRWEVHCKRFKCFS